MGEPFAVKKFAGGTRLVSFAVATDVEFGHNATIQYIERPTPGGSLGTEEHSTAWFQRYLRHNAKMFMTSPTSCWPIWGDNHISLFLNTDSNETSDDAVIQRFKAYGWSEFHPFLG